LKYNLQYLGLNYFQCSKQAVCFRPSLFRQEYFFLTEMTGFLLKAL